MAVIFVFEAQASNEAHDTAGQEGYDAVMRDIGREDLESSAAEGIIFHISGPRAGGGWRVIDCWESEEAAGRFYGTETFQKAVREHLPPIEPQMSPLHRLEVYRVLREKA
ncbi:MAG: hypothetical protein ABR564_06345 [Candidatus Dormibacteria bacterium]